MHKTLTRPAGTGGAPLPLPGSARRAAAWPWTARRSWASRPRVSASTVRSLAPALPSAALRTGPVPFEASTDRDRPTRELRAGTREDPGQLLRLRLTNRSSDRLAIYKVKTTAPKRYRVNPNAAEIQPGQTVEVKGACLRRSRAGSPSLRSLLLTARVFAGSPAAGHGGLPRAGAAA